MKLYAIIAADSLGGPTLHAGRLLTEQEFLRVLPRYDIAAIKVGVLTLEDIDRKELHGTRHDPEPSPR